MHHGKHELYRNKNHGGTFVIWDKWFGTFQAELPELPRDYGLAGQAPIYNPVSANLNPVLAYFGWSSTRQARSRYIYPEGYLFGGTALLTLLFVYFVYLAEASSAMTAVWLVAYLFVGTFLLGAIAEGYRYGLIGWVALTLLGGTALWIGVEYWTGDSLGVLLLAVLGVHGALVIRYRRAPCLLPAPYHDAGVHM